jgi:hypothetical protein
MIIEVYALSELKKIRQRTAVNADKKVTQVFESHNTLHLEWIKPLTKGSYYKGKKEHQFTVGTDEDFEQWKSSLCGLVHEMTLDQFRVINDQQAAFYPLLTCSSIETAFGSEVSEKLFVDFLKTWPYIIQMQEDDIEDVVNFCDDYLNWSRSFYLGKQNGIVELF